MANLKVMDQNGKDSGEVTLNDKVFGIEPNESVVFEAIIRPVSYTHLTLPTILLV